MAEDKSEKSESRYVDVRPITINDAKDYVFTRGIKTASEYNEGFANFLQRRFINNELGLVPIDGSYENGVRGVHNTFDLRIEYAFLNTPSKKNLPMDFMVEMDFSKSKVPSNPLLAGLEVRTDEYGVVNCRELLGHKEGDYSKFFKDLEMDYDVSIDPERRVLTLDSSVVELPRNEQDIYGDAWKMINTSFGFLMTPKR